MHGIVLFEEGVIALEASQGQGGMIIPVHDRVQEVREALGNIGGTLVA